MIHVTLGPRRPVDPATDGLGRTHIGYEPGMTEADLYQAARGCWVLGARAGNQRTLVASHDGVIVFGMSIDRLVDVGRGRRAAEGTPWRESDPAFTALVGKPSPVHGVRNPVTYVADIRDCACGCGEQTARGAFLPGHDQRAIHDRIAKVGSVLDFLDWFDRTWQPQGPAASPD